MTINIEELRRLAQAALIAPGSLSPEWMDRLGQFQEAADPAAVSELLDRLEEARTAWKEANKACRDLTEKVIPNLRESLEAAERDVALKEKVIDALGSELNAVAKERGALQAKIDAMEKQEPVYLFRRKGLDDFCTCSKERYEAFSANPRLFEVKTLYTLPGAKGEGK